MPEREDQSAGDDDSGNQAATVERLCKLAYDVLLTNLTPTEMKWSDMVGMKASLIERAAEVYWGGAVRRLLREESDVLL